MLEAGSTATSTTRPLVRLDDWIPKERRREARLIVGIEYDETQDPHYSDTRFPVQFCQWTIAAAPNHPVLAKMVNRAMAGIRDVAMLDKSEVSDVNVLNATGPLPWTEIVFEALQEVDGSNIKSYRDLAGIKEPQYYGDIVVLPLEGFRADSMDDWGIHWRSGRRALVRHYYNAGWRTP